MPLSKKVKVYTRQEALLKVSSYCVYQERTQQEVRDQLYGYGLHKDMVEELISKLITENFINEERFAKAFSGGKFRIKKWGRVRIKEALKAKGLSEYCIKKGLQEIDSKDYTLSLLSLIEKRNEKEKEKNEFKRKHKIAQYLIGKGYEAELVWDTLGGI
jgi:regulatory protein